MIAPTFGPISEPLTGRRLEPGQMASRIEERIRAYRSLGVRHGHRVLIGFGNRIEFFADLLAVWRIGACAVPLDARLTTFELETLARAARPRAFIGYGPVADELDVALAGQGIAVLDASATEPEGETGRSITPPDYRLDDDALILFTSGTTGSPKGVVHTHRSLLARWLSLRQCLGIEPYRRTLCLLPTHFGHGLICNALFPWLAGQELFILPPFSPEVAMRLGELIDDNRITFLSSVPAVWRLALKTARPPSAGTIERVFIGSAPLSAHLWSEIRRWSGIREVCNAYGITETGSWVGGTTVGDFEPEDGLIGVPWGAAVAITKDGSPDQPPGVGELARPGESGFVWLNTPALMKGYLDRDDLTTQCVRGGWFLTGDLGAIDERGWLTLRGRVRDEINKGGAKVYPADVEAVVEQFDGVDDLCCFAVEDAHYGQNVALALVLRDPTPERLRSLHQRLRQRLAEHQMPIKWFLLEHLPRTSRGKINRDHIAEACSRLAAVNLRAVLSRSA